MNKVTLLQKILYYYNCHFEKNEFNNCILNTLFILILSGETRNTI